MKAGRSESLFRKRLRKFRRLKRGYYSFLIVVVAYLFSFLLPFVMTGQPLLVRYDGHYYFPMLKFHSVTEFGVVVIRPIGIDVTDAITLAIGTDSEMFVTGRSLKYCDVPVRRHAILEEVLLGPGGKCE